MGQGGLSGVINDLPTNRNMADETAADDPIPPADVPVLYLANEDWLSGRPAASQADKLGWQSPDFTRPFEFDLSAVTRVRFSTTVTPGWREHEYRLELAGGDVLYGDLLSVTDANLLFRSSLADELLIKRSAVRCLERCKANPLVYVGPNGLAEWQMPREPGAWREEEGQLVTDKDGAALYRPIELPAKALVEFELSSLFPPVFRFSLGVTDGETIRRDGFRLEVVDFDVIAVYETDDDIDVAKVMTLTPGTQRDHVRLRILLDQRQHRADVFSAEGLPLASVQVKSVDARVLPGVCLEHKRGGLRLELLRIWNWSGPLPQSLTIDRPQLHRVDGKVVEGTLAGYDEKQRQFNINTAEGPLLCGGDEVARIYFGEPGEVDERPLRVAGKDGTLLSGWFAGIDAERLALDCLSIDTPQLETPTVPIAGLAGIAFSYKPSEEIPNRSLLVRSSGGRMHGCLSPHRAEAGSSAVCWLPAGATQPAPLREDASAQIVSQSLARFGSLRARAGGPPADAALVRRFLLNEARQSAAGDGRQGKLPVKIGYDTIYLVRGDMFRCEITGIDERGVRCRTASAEKQLAHADIKAIDLADSTEGAARARLTFADLAQQREAARVAGANTNNGNATAYAGLAALDREKFSRLLTLPRLLRDDPPTHILCAANGDCLRGRLLGMADGNLRFAAGESQREFQRERIAAIVWLHPEGRQEGTDDDLPRPANLAHAVCADGTRLTFFLEEIDEHVLTGTSEILGDCQLPLDRLSELLLGKGVSQAASQTAYHDWTLTLAPEPKAFQAGDEAADGTDSPLIGQPAPDFELPTIGGGTFRLSQHRGRVVVLDFWASWCAPCMKGLPKLVRVLGGVETDQAELLAINLRESAEEAGAALSRMGLDIAAALDRDGAVAGRYGATAIPHTVVIGADGRVVRVFIGSGAETEVQLKAVIRQKSP